LGEKREGEGEEKGKRTGSAIGTVLVGRTVLAIRTCKDGEFFIFSLYPLFLFRFIYLII
jgi:hypothetical protein